MSGGRYIAPGVAQNPGRGGVQLQPVRTGYSGMSPRNGMGGGGVQPNWGNQPTEKSGGADSQVKLGRAAKIYKNNSSVTTSNDNSLDLSRECLGRADDTYKYSSLEGSFQEQNNYSLGPNNKSNLKKSKSNGESLGLV